MTQRDLFSIVTLHKLYSKQTFHEKLCSRVKALVAGSSQSTIPDNELLANFIIVLKL